MAELTEKILEQAIENFKLENPDKVWEEVSQEMRWDYIAKAEATEPVVAEKIADEKTPGNNVESEIKETKTETTTEVETEPTQEGN